MCGIFCSLTKKDDPIVKKILKNETIQRFLAHRGPDHFEKVIIDCGCSRQFAITELSSVLQLRGKLVTNQPYQGKASNSMLQWNGQVFGGLDLDEDKSDTEQIMALLEAAKNDADVLKVLGSIRGPWAFTYWDDKAQKLWVGRDILGRRSLCWNTNFRDDILIISSVAQIVNYKTIDASVPSMLTEMQFEELPTTGVFCFNVNRAKNLKDVNLTYTLYPWNCNVVGDPSVTVSELKLQSPINVPMNLALPNIAELKDESMLVPKNVIEEFGAILSSAIERRCRNHHNVCKKCFSRYVKQNELSAVASVKANGNGFSSDSDDDVGLPASPTPNTINGVTFRGCTHASTAILFSGGLDSTVIALLADWHVPENLPIDLLNVAFSDQAPDRETALCAWNELQKICPQRKWNFVSILVNRDELRRCREEQIKYLVRPSDTVLDDSIGCAVWFATRGTGLLMAESGLITCSYQTRARVVLLGMGADEQLAGYSRHRAAFGAVRSRNGDFERLVAEVKYDVARIATRNLGRDDRITSDHGIEARYPFLDEEVVNYLNSLPIWQKADLSLERGVGEKLLLRTLANDLELRETARHLKRAIQFGSHIAKFNEMGEKGNDKSIHL